MQKIDKHPIYVEPFHVDFTGRIFMGVLGNHLLNAAGNHSQSRGWGIGALNETQHTWVLSRLSIEMMEMPQQYEHCTVTTWVESVMKLFTNRNFAIHSAEGKPLGFARSVWAMIDLDTRRPCDLLSLYDGDILRYIVEDKDIEDELGDKLQGWATEGQTVTTAAGLCPIDGHGRFRFRDAETVRTIQTYYSDVDINGHINSIKYIEHILDLFPKELFERGIRRFEIAYKTESYMGDTLTFHRQVLSEQETDIEVRKNVTDDSNGEVVCQAKIIFN